MQLEVLSNHLVELRDAVKDARDLLDQTMAMVQATIRAIIKAGKLLKTARGELQHGEWYQWLEINVPEISRETARRWMRLAEFDTMHGAEIENASTVKQAYQLAGLLPEPESSASNGKTEGSDAYLTHLDRTISKLTECIQQNPLETWPSDRVATLQQRLRKLFDLSQPVLAA